MSNCSDKQKKSYFEKLNPSVISDNKKFWKTVKSFFSDKMVSSDSITLVEDNNIITNSSKIAEIFGSFFSNAVKNLNIDMHRDIFNDKCSPTNDLADSTDPISKAIEKYENHPSILKINECSTINGNFSFKTVSIETVHKEIRDLCEKSLHHWKQFQLRLSKITMKSFLKKSRLILTML